jgi:lipopolysaccharide transport system permease protein
MTQSPVELLRVIWRNRVFALAMAERELRGMTKGLYLGMAWLVLTPFIKVAAYVIIVTFVFGDRLDPSLGVANYAIYVLSGVIPWQLMVHALETAPALVRDRQDLVKQVIYPLETLPVTGILVGAIGPLVGLVTLAALSLVSGAVGWSWLLLPLPVALLLALCLGMAWAFAIVGVVFKDLREIVSVVLGLMVYLSPVLLREDLVGSRVWQFVLWNPLSHVIISFRDIFAGQFHAASWVVFALMSGAALLLGGLIMARTKLLINEYI